MATLSVVARPTDRETDDSDLVAAVRAGDDRSFEILFERYQARITNYVRGMVRDHGRAEDITQEVFISALRRMRETDREIAFRPWIYEIAKNACIDAFRRSRRMQEVSFDAQSALGPIDQGSRFAAPALTPDEAVEGKVAFDNLRGALGGLSETHHDILVMREFEGLSYRVIGERLGMSGPAVESTLFRARRRLSEEYEELASGERCRRVQRIVEASVERSVGLRDQRRMAKHLSHCQPCRRFARLSGYDLDVAARPASVATRIAAFLPLPEFLRRRAVADDAGVGALLSQSSASAAPMAHWSASIASVVDPATASGWSKAIVTAAGVAVAGVGGGAAITDRSPLERFGAPAPAIHGLPTVPSLDGSSLPSVVLPDMDAASGAEAPAAETLVGTGGAPGSSAAGVARGGQARQEALVGAGEAPHTGVGGPAGDAPAAGSKAASGVTVKATNGPLSAKETANVAFDGKGDGVGATTTAGKAGGLIGGGDSDRGSGGSGAAGAGAPDSVGAGVVVTLTADGAGGASPSQTGGTMDGASAVVKGLGAQVGGPKPAAGGGSASQSGSATSSGAADVAADTAQGVVDTVPSTVTGTLNSNLPASPVP